jgi:spore maturation protein CgeB
MRTLIVDTSYPAFLSGFYAARPDLPSERYDVQWRALMDEFFGTADSYSHHLTALGHPSHEFVVNCAPLQARWALEHGLRVPPARFRGDRRGRDAILLAQAADFAPDVVYVQNLEILSDRTLRALRQTQALIVGQLSTEPPRLRRLRAFDHLVSPVPSFVDRLRAEGLAADYLALAFDDRAIEKAGVSGDGPVFDTVFVGSLKRFRRWKSNRVIERAARQVPIQFWGYGEREWPKTSPVRMNFCGTAWGLDMLRLLRDARISINRHGDLTGPYAANMRLYEATGMGSLLVTDAKRNLPDLFEPGAEVIAYNNEKELVEAVRHYTANEPERASIAAAGQTRTLRDHSYARRMAELAAILEKARVG